MADPVKPTKKIWLDGELVDWDKANVHILTHTLSYGIGVFEGIRSYVLKDGKVAIFRLKDHIRRFFDGMKILAMETPFNEEQIADACIKIVKLNGMGEMGYIRPLAFLGDGEMGVDIVRNTRMAVVAWKWGAYSGEGAIERGVRAKVSSFSRHHVNVGMVQGKIIGQYVTAALAKHEVLVAGYQEAIMLDTQGYVAECSGQNIFAVRDGVIFTPPTNSPILPGVTRSTVMTLAREMDMEVREERFTRDFLYICDEVFVTGTAAEITPVTEIDDRKIGMASPGPITLRLQKSYFGLVRGSDDRHSHWLCTV